MIIVLCGSMAFAKEMQKIQHELEEKGHTILGPASIEAFVSGTLTQDNEGRDVKIKNDLIRDHRRKIQAADAILVVNGEKNGIKGYVGGNGLMEIGFAYVLDKKIYLRNDIPEMSYSVEIETTQPIILHQDLENVEETKRLSA